MVLGDRPRAGGCATRPAPGTPRAPRRPSSGGGRGPRSGGARRRARRRGRRRRRGVPPARGFLRCVAALELLPAFARYPLRGRRPSESASSRSGSYRQRCAESVEPDPGSQIDALAAPLRRVGPRFRRCAARAPRRSARSVSSRPSSATLSKMPGETVVPGERDAQRLVDLARLDAARARRRRSAPRSTVGSSNGSAPARARRAPRASTARPSSPSQRSRAVGSSTGPVDSEPASGQKSASVWIFSWLIARRRAEAARARVDSALAGTPTACQLVGARAARGCRGRSASAASPRRSAPGCG